jgi:hypothetical protein
MHVQCIAVGICTTKVFHLCRQEYSFQRFTIMVATFIGVAAFLFL